MATIIVLLCGASATAAFVQPVAVDATLRRHATLRMSWDDPDWNWGSANGEAHKEAARLRSSLSTAASREKFLTNIGMMDPLDFDDGKIVLALKCQRASKRCYAADYDLDEEEQQAWQALMDDMAACKFEGYGGDLKLAAAIGDRLGLIESKRLSNL